MAYNPSIGAPNWGPVNTYSRDSARNLPKSWEEARIAHDWAHKRRAGAKGMLARNTWIHEVPVRVRNVAGSAIGYAIKFHQTDVVTYLPDGTVELDSGGYQTFSTRDRINRCGFRLGMSKGVPSLPWGDVDVPFRDGMRLCPNGRVTGPPVVGTVAEIQSRRARVLARARREANGDGWTYAPFYWPLRSGGETHYKGTVPEAFRTDLECGLKVRTQRKGA